MNFTDVLSHLLQLLAGIGTFMVACEIMSDNLQAISSNKLKSLFSKVSDNKIIGVGIGALTTAAIQSSGAVNVMVMGFVNAGIVSLNQAATIIFGTEIGTTLTGQIVALGMFGDNGISTTTLFAAFIGIGAFIDIFAKKDKNKKIGGIMIGFGMIFVGLSMMNSAMDSFANLDALKIFLSKINSSVLLIIIGAILTAIVQSSSAITTVAITMIVSGLISLQQGIYITLGANVGSCVTGVMAALTSSINAKRVSLLQLIFNIGGVVLITIIDGIIQLITNQTNSISIIFMNLFPGVPQTQLAMFHTIFNIGSVILALPISEKIVDIVVKLMPLKQTNLVDNHLHYFDYNMMSSPSIATQQIKKEVINMAQIAINNFNIAVYTISTMDFSKQEEFKNNEDELNYLNHHLVQIVSELIRKTISKKDNKYLSSTYRTISDFERIGDYSENIMEYAEHLNSINQSFNKDALKEIEHISELINSLYNISMDIYEKYDSKKFKKAGDIEQEVDDYTEKMADNHIRRMNGGECDADIGNQYLQLTSDVERIADHLININDKDFILSH